MTVASDEPGRQELIENVTLSGPVLSVLVPALNAARTLPTTLAALNTTRPSPVIGGFEVVVIDGGSTDTTTELAASLGVRVIAAQRGRGGQLAAGAAACRGDWLLFLHADTRLGPGWLEAVSAHMANTRERAGYFRFALDSEDPRARRLERLVAWRCRFLGLPYGDQGLLVHRELLNEVGGIRPLPLMEDVDLVRRLGQRRLALLPADALTSAERWERDGWLRRSARNFACLALYFGGMPPGMIAKLYS